MNTVTKRINDTNTATKVGRDFWAGALVLFALLLPQACGFQGSQCTAYADCLPGEQWVESCDGLENCYTTEVCGSVASCVLADIKASDYDQTCSADTDCFLINEGHPCDCHVCPDAAVNVSAQGEYDNIVSSHSCEETECPDVECEQEPVAFCNAGTCDVR